MFETRLMRDIVACGHIISDRNTANPDRLDAICLKTDLGIIMIRMFREGAGIINIDKLEQREAIIVR